VRTFQNTIIKLRFIKYFPLRVKELESYKIADVIHVRIHI